MNIDSKLEEFQTKVAPNISKLETSRATLSSDILNFKNINDSISSSLSTAFKSDAGEKVTAEINILNQTITKVQNSLETELTIAITKCQNLNEGIEKLKQIKMEYDNINSQYNSLDDDNKNKSSLSGRLTSLNNEFQTSQIELLKVHNEILNLDSSLTILSDFAPKQSSSLSSSFTANYTGTEFSSIYYYQDGIVYQKVFPICAQGKTVKLNDTYTVIYNIANIEKTAGNTKYTQELINFLNDKVNGNSKESYLWDYSTKNYKKSTSEEIGKIMNQILQDTYKANNAKTIVDYAALAAMVANTSAVHLGYGGNSAQCDYGFETILKGGGDLDCIGFVRWCYSQGLYEVGIVKSGEKASKYISQGSSMTPLNLLANHSAEISKMSMTERANIPVGSVLSRPCYDGAGNVNNYHVGIVIGHTTDENGKPAIVVAQSSNTTIGANNRVYPLEELASGKNKWTNVSTPEMMTTRVTQGSFKGKTWVA